MIRKILPALGLAAMLALLQPTPVAAADGDIFFGDTIPAGMIIDHDVILIGQEVRVEGVVHGNIFILGNQVILGGEIDGSLVVIAQNASLGAKLSGAAYVLALTLDLPAQAVLERDLYAATVSLTSSADSTISRRLYALGLDAGLNGQIGGELHTMLGPIQLYNGLMRLLGFEELTLQLHFEVPVPADSSQVTAPVQYMRLKLVEPPPSVDWAAWAVSRLKHWAVLLVFGLCGLFLAPKQLEHAGLPLAEHPWRALGIGVLVLVVSFNLFIVGLLVFIIVFAIGLGLNALGLWQVTLALWVVAFSTLVITLVGLGLFIAIGTKIVVGYLAASYLLNSIFRREHIGIAIAALTLGTLLFVLLRAIPYAGWVIDLLVTSAGMGAVWFALSRHLMKTGQAAPQAVKKTAIRTR